MHSKVLEHIPLKLNLHDIKYLIAPLKTSEVRISKLISIKSKIVKEKKIPKKNPDEFRLINYPVGEFKLILKRLNKFLMKRTKFPNNICGGIVDKNLYDMVKEHCGREGVYQIDLKDFFPNINSNRVYSFFRYSGCSEIISQILTDLVTFDKKLPQGFPTSPIVANLVAWKMDYDLQSICNKHKLNYSRWVDDILISGRISELNNVVYNIDKSIRKNGFYINPKKKRLVKRNNSKEIIAVGLDLKKHKPDVPIKVFEKLEYILQVLLTEGVEFAHDLFEEEFKSKDIQQSLIGKIRFVEEYSKVKGKTLRNLYEQINWSNQIRIAT
jgi:hypothetical protein